MAKKYELGLPFCAERLMLINGALDAAKKMIEVLDRSDGQLALLKLADLWSVDLVDGEYEVEPIDTSISKSDIEDALGAGEMTITQLAKACVSDVKTVRPILRKLVKDGYVVAEGEKRSTVYRWVKPVTVN